MIENKEVAPAESQSQAEGVAIVESQSQAEGKISAGLWKSKSISGNVYYNGKLELGGALYKVLLFQNTTRDKEHTNRPHVNIVLEPILPSENGQQLETSGEITF